MSTWAETVRRQKLRDLRASTSPREKKRKPKTTKPPRGGTPNR